MENEPGGKMYYFLLKNCDIPASYVSLPENPLPETSKQNRQKPSYFPLYWFVNRDHYRGLLYIIPI